MQFRSLLLLACFSCTGAIVRQQHAFLHAAHGQSSGLLQRQEYGYHSTDEIHQELVALSSRCHGMTLDTKQAGSQFIDVVTIKAPGSKPLNKNFMLFGEHARELISPESSLHFIKTLCGETGDNDRASRILKDSEFQMVVNANPESRKAVEQGDACLRSNPNGVDLNRNWAKGWEPVAPFAFMSQTSGGEKPFSEPETQLFKELVSAYKPTMFLSIHSGTKGMYMPWAFNGTATTRNQAAMLDVLNAVDKNHCECPFGAMGKALGYKCDGTSLDWVYDELKTPYAFTFEIYGPPSENDGLRDAWRKQTQTAGAFYQGQALHPLHFSERQTDLVQVKGEPSDAGHCFSLFNPDSKATYDSTVQTWSAAYLDTAELVAANMKKQGF